MTYNLLALLDTLDQFVTVRDSDFVFKMQRDEAPVLREYAIPLAKEALKTLSARYEFTPTGPILVEIFPQHDDFAVRNLGLPGMIGALGACFGRVVTLDSPHGAAAGHVQLGGHALARADPRHHAADVEAADPALADRRHFGLRGGPQARRVGPRHGSHVREGHGKGKVLKLRDLNAGFTKPDTIALSYYEASLLVDHIVETLRSAALNALVRSYGEGIDTETALKRALSVIDRRSAGVVRRGARDAVRRHAPRGSRRGHARRRPVDRGTAELRPLRSRTATSRSSRWGRRWPTPTMPPATAPLERASVLVPSAIGPESPHLLMAAARRRAGRHARAMKEYEALLAVDHTNVEAARRLVDAGGQGRR